MAMLVMVIVAVTRKLTLGRATLADGLSEHCYFV